MGLINKINFQLEKIFENGVIVSSGITVTLYKLKLTLVKQKMFGESIVQEEVWLLVSVGGCF